LQLGCISAGIALVSHDRKERALLVFDHQRLGGAIGRSGLHLIHVASCPEEIADLDGEDLGVADKVCGPSLALRDVTNLDGPSWSHEKGEGNADALDHRKRRRAGACQCEQTGSV
jgi:hypothetical protein